MARFPVIPSCSYDNPLKVGETRFQPFQLALENDVLLRAHAKEENGLGVKATVIDIPKYRDYGSNPAAAGEEDYRLVFIRVEAELAKRSPCLHRQAHRSLRIKEIGNTSTWLFLHGDFDKASLRW